MAETGGGPRGGGRRRPRLLRSTMVGTATLIGVTLACATPRSPSTAPPASLDGTAVESTILASGDSPPEDDPANPLVVSDDAPATAAWPESIEVSGVTYDVPYGPAPEHVLDIYLPEETRFDRLPIVLFIHGGAWSGGSRDHLLSFSGPLLDMLDQGWAIASVGYRTTTVGPHPRQLADVQRAIRWVREIAPAIGFDPESVVVAGHSAGGHLAMLAGTIDEIVGESLDRSPESLAASRPDGVIAFAPVTDLITFAEMGPLEAGAVGELLGCPSYRPLCDPELAERLSPMAHLDRDDSPLYLAHGRADSMVPFDPQATVAYRRYAEVLGSDRVWFNVVADENHDLRGVDGGSLATFLSRIRSGSIG